MHMRTFNSYVSDLGVLAHERLHAMLMQPLGLRAVLMSYTYSAMNDLFGTAGSPARLKVRTRPPRLWSTAHRIYQQTV